MDIQNLGNAFSNLASSSQGAAASRTHAYSTSTDTSTSSADTATQIAPGQLMQAVQQLNHLVNAGHDLKLTFTIDTGTRQPVVSVTDATTGTVIRQISPAEAMAIARMPETKPGMLLALQA